jgi:hypothetical protein
MQFCRKLLSQIINLRETKAKELLDRANQDIVRHFSRGSLFRAQSLFIATWIDVGRYDNKNSPVRDISHDIHMTFDLIFSKD